MTRSCHRCSWRLPLQPESRWLIFTILLAVLAQGSPNSAAAEPKGASSKSFFLVAGRDMPDPVFQKSVILVLPPDDPLLVAGIIINKPTDMAMGNLLREPLAPAERNQKVYFGGPVNITSPLLVARSSHPPDSAIRLWSNVYAVFDPSAIVNVLKGKRAGDDARLFMGRAQWTQDQLRGELLEGAWTVVPVRPDLIFEHDSAKIWPMLSQHEHVREVKTRCYGGRDGSAFPCAARNFRGSDSSGLALTGILTGHLGTNYDAPGTPRLADGCESVRSFTIDFRGWL